MLKANGTYYLLVFTNICTFIVVKILHKQSLMLVKTNRYMKMHGETIKIMVHIITIKLPSTTKQ